MNSLRLLVDAQLPPSLASLLRALGHEAMHVEELPDGVATPDTAIAAAADADDLIVVTKDADFRHSRIARGMPRRLLVVATGNITNRTTA